MPTLITNFNWGRGLRNNNPELNRQLSEAYTETALCVNTKTSRYVTDVDPPDSVTPLITNKNFEIGDFWVNKTTDTAWMMTSRTTDLIVTWTQIT